MHITCLGNEFTVIILTKVPPHWIGVCRRIWYWNAVLGWMLRTIQVLLEIVWGCLQLPQHKIDKITS